MTDFSDMAKGIIESNRFMVLGTAALLGPAEWGSTPGTSRPGRR